MNFFDSVLDPRYFRFQMKILRPFLLILLLLPLAVGCSTASRDSSSAQAFSAAVVDQEVMGKWARSCALCHVDGVADAPVVGDTEEWRRRLEQGEDVVMRNVLEGYNSMPPLGYCMACEISDFRAMIAFMAGTNQ